ncbi:MAG TPA: hypothetical protein VKE74_04490, partial [Gemmataceae bacterium]|nr:hypothetical protein [Gemmataceae bacterium]
NRANAYQLQNRHDLALRDFARAVVLDSKYAAAYCVQRGLHEIRRRRAKLALADFAVALTIDPNNRTAKAGREEAQVLAETDFHVTSEADVYRSAEHTPLAEREPPLKAELVEESADETPQRPAVATGFDMNAATQAAGGPGRAGLLAESPLPGAVPIEVPASLAQEVEERQFRQEQEKLRLAAVEAKAAELRKKNEEEEKKRKELAKKRKRKEDPEERALRMRKYKRYAIIAAGLVVVLYYGAQLVMALIPKPESPFDEYTAEELIEQYAKDTIAADDKFADQRICLRGRIKVVQEKGKGLIPPKVFFESAGHSEVRVEVQFANEDVVSALKDRQEYRINGKMSRFKPGVGLTMKDANLMPHQPGAGGASVRFRWDDRWLAAGSRRGVLLPPDPLFHAIHLMPSYDRHNCPLMITPTNEPRRDAALGGPERPTVTLIL